MRITKTEHALGCAWLLRVVAAHGCCAWLLRVVALCGCYVWLLRVFWHTQNLYARKELVRDLFW